MVADESQTESNNGFHCYFWVPSNASAEVFKRQHLLGSFQAFHIQCLIYCNLSKHNSVRSCLLFAAAAAESLQSCPTLCDPIDGSPPGSPVPGIHQARTRVGWHFLPQCVKVKSLSHVWLLGTPWTAACQAPPSMEFSRQEYWSGLHCLLFIVYSHSKR